METRPLSRLLLWRPTEKEEEEEEEEEGGAFTTSVAFSFLQKRRVRFLVKEEKGEGEEKGRAASLASSEPFLAFFLFQSLKLVPKKNALYSKDRERSQKSGFPGSRCFFLLQSLVWQFFAYFTDLATLLERGKEEEGGSEGQRHAERREGTDPFQKREREMKAKAFLLLLFLFFFFGGVGGCVRSLLFLLFHCRGFSFFPSILKCSAPFGKSFDE